VDEFLCQLKGATFLVNHLSDEKLCFPWIHLPESIERVHSIEHIETQQIINGMTEGGQEKEIKRLPALFVFLGSAAGFMLMYEDGRRTPMLEMNIFGGKSFLGLSRCLLGTGDYLEITKLASKGKGNTDFCIQDILPNINPYWKGENPDTCLYAFGKLSEDVDTDYSKEDLALSICRGISSSLANTITTICRDFHIKKVYVGGNMARAEFMRISLLKALDTIRVLDSLDVRFMNTGHTGAIGSFISDPEEFKKLFINLQEEATSNKNAILSIVDL